MGTGVLIVTINQTQTGTGVLITSTVNINKPWDCMSYLIANKEAEIMGTGVLLLTINQTCTFLL